MKYSISKNKNKYKASKKLSFKDGFNFNKTVSITIYDEDMIKSVINNKIKSRLNKISILYMLYENDDEDESTGRLIEIKIEELRRLLLGEYHGFLSESKVHGLEKDLTKISEKINKRDKIKTR